MNKSEFALWRKYSRSRKGRWTVREGRSEYLLYKSDSAVIGEGTYIIISLDGSMTGGIYTDAIPDIDHANFHSKWAKKFTREKDALIFAAANVVRDSLFPLLKERHSVSHAQIVAAKLRRR